MGSQTKYNLLEFILFPPKGLSIHALKGVLSGKTVLITGASYGIGESVAYMLADTGANLILVARTEEKLLSVKKEVEQRGGKASICPTDLSKPEQVQSLIDFISGVSNGIDLIINNAGKSIHRSINDSIDRYHDFTRTMAINYLGPVQLLLPLIPILKKNKGHIINISAVNVLLAPAPYWAAYQASKTAFDNWFRCASPELNAEGVNTTSIYLPLVRTRMIEPTVAYKDMPAMKPEYVARIICRYAISKGKKFTPWWLIFGQLASVILRRPWEYFATRYVKRKLSHDTVKETIPR